MYHKYLYLVLSFIIFSTFACQNNDSSTTQAPNTSAHNYVGKGKMMKVATMSGGDANAYVVTPKRRDKNVLFVFPDYNGIDDFVRQEVDYLFEYLIKDNVLIFAIDTYDGKTFNSEEEALAFQQANIGRIRHIITGAKGFAGSHARIATLGWGAGADMALEAAILNQDQGVGCIMYDGVAPKNAVDLSRLKSPILAFFGKKDTRMTPEDISNFEANCKLTRNQLILRQYETKKGFTYKNTPTYNAPAAHKSKQATIDFLSQCY